MQQVLSSMALGQIPRGREVRKVEDLSGGKSVAQASGCASVGVVDTKQHNRPWSVVWSVALTTAVCYVIVLCVRGRPNVYPVDLNRTSLAQVGFCVEPLLLDGPSFRAKLEVRVDGICGWAPDTSCTLPMPESLRPLCVLMI